MKVYTKEGLITLSVEYLFQLISRAWVLKTKTDKYEIYCLVENEEETRFRVNLPNGDAFEVMKINKGDTVQLRNDDWITVNSPIFQYGCCSKTFNGSPRVTFENAYNIFINQCLTARQHIIQ